MVSRWSVVFASCYRDPEIIDIEMRVYVYKDIKSM